MAENVTQATSVGFTGFRIKKQHIVQVSGNPSAQGIFQVVGKVEIMERVIEGVTDIPVNIIGLLRIGDFKFKGGYAVYQPDFLTKILVFFIYPVFITGTEPKKADQQK